jgi:DDE superfamily endonuclease
MTINRSSRARKARSNTQQQQITSMLNITIINLVVVVIGIIMQGNSISHKGSIKGRRFIKRKRKKVEDIHKQLGDIYFRRAYRMDYLNFQNLASLLSPLIISFSNKKQNSRNYIHNGTITPDVRLACALRWFAGGSTHDIMTTYGISRTETINSIWYVVDAVNNHPELKITFPEDHVKQQAIAEGFVHVSSAGFKSCVGAIDGILIWIHKPADKDCINSGCNTGSFFCERKNKFGLNCQAVCDVKGRFLDLSIVYPGCTSDCLAFEGMTLYEKLENGLLAPGLCLFGDNAYMNSPYMATPYPALQVSGGTKDSYNFYHSQVRIRIECAFGMLTHRWAILRSAIPTNVPIHKTVALVVALAKLHNFCIDRQDGNPPSPTPSDALRHELRGVVPLQPIEVSESTFDVTPRQLLGGGHHFDDIGTTGRTTRQQCFNNQVLPREILHSLVADAGLTRPKMKSN